MTTKEIDLETTFSTRLGLDVPREWWPSASLLKGIEAAGFCWVQLPAPPVEVLASARLCHRHAAAAAGALGETGLHRLVHGPDSLALGSPEADRVFRGLLAYAAECGAAMVVHHAANVVDGHHSTRDRLLFERRSLARLAAEAERLGLTIAIENLAPVFPGTERLCHSPRYVQELVAQIDSPAVGLCLDLGHAHIVAALRRTGLLELLEATPRAAVLFHLHDNLGARWGRQDTPGLDPLRLDLHLPPGDGSLPWAQIAPLLAGHSAPLMLEIKPPHRPPAALLHDTTHALLAREGQSIHMAA